MKRKIITDDMLIDAAMDSKSIMGVLRFLGIKEAGGSHTHYSKRIKSIGINTEHFEREFITKESHQKIKNQKMIFLF